MKRKILLVDEDKCTGCRICEVSCSLHHEEESNPTLSRIHVHKWEELGLFIPVVCRQCATPHCAFACPQKAIYKDEKTGVYNVDVDLCTGCRVCMMVCPFGGLTLNKTTKKIVKCDLCEGEPRCVKTCPTSALAYGNYAETLFHKRKSLAQVPETP